MVYKLTKPDPNTGKVQIICSRDTFSIIRSMISFRLTGGTKAGLPKLIIIVIETVNLLENYQ